MIHILAGHQDVMDTENQLPPGKPVVGDIPSLQLNNFAASSPLAKPAWLELRCRG